MTRVFALAGLVLLALLMTGCVHPMPPPRTWNEVKRIVLADDLLPEVEICVPLHPVATAPRDHPNACIRMTELRQLLRSQRLVTFRIAAREP